MSNRDELNTIRTTLLDLDEPLKAAQAAVPSPAAAVQLGRARGMIRGAKQLVDLALRERVDGLPDTDALAGARL